MSNNDYFGYDHGEDDLIAKEERSAEMNRSGFAPVLVIWMVVVGIVSGVCFLIVSVVCR